MVVSAKLEVSVAVPARNGLPDVLDAVRSALDQSAPPAEVVVANDGSTDGTGDALRAAFGDRVRILDGRWGSAAAARNAAWRAGRAPWVAFLDADDLWLPDKLAAAAGVLAAVPDAIWFFSDGAFRTLEGVIESSWLERYADLDEGYVGSPVAELMEVNFVLTSSVVVRRDALEALGGFREDMSHAEDADLWIRLARRGRAAATRRPLVRYQHRPGGLTRQLEARLLGSASLYRRLAADPTLAAPLRRVARRRVALAHHKLAVAALREGRGREARRHLGAAWLFPERAVACAVLWAAAHAPAPLLAALRARRALTRGVAAPLGRHRRVALRRGISGAAGSAR
jgi:GT2 family glycosyltransferase